MFARSVSIRLKSNSVSELNRVLENEILPLLRKQKGFQDELTLIASTLRETMAYRLHLVRIGRRQTERSPAVPLASDAESRSAQADRRRSESVCGTTKRTRMLTAARVIQRCRGYCQK
jgi:hypothetical protein